MKGIWLTLLKLVLSVIIEHVTPELRKWLEAAVLNFEKTAESTPAYWDDAVVKVLKIVLKID